MMTVTLLTMLHVLILVYWLGGDLGAFYGSTFLKDPNRSVPERLLALKILNNIDMAPRTALILALPTGVLLADAKGWIDLPDTAVGAIVAAGLAWLGIAWTVHVRHGRAEGLRRIDLAIRWIFMLLLAASAIAGIVGTVEMPRFIAYKMLVLAACIMLGLIVRMQLGPLFPAIREMVQTGPTPQTDATIRGVLAETRVVVLILWAMLFVALYLGVATPT